MLCQKNHQVTTNAAGNTTSNAASAIHPRTLTRREATLFAAGSVVAGSALLAGCGASAGDSADGESNDDATDAPDGAATAQDGVDAAEQQVSDLLASMTLEQKVAQLFFVAPESVFPADPVTAAGDASRQAYADCPVGGVCYFGKNLVDVEQTRSMLASVAQFGRDAVGVAPFISVDEEGGTVARIAGNAALGVENVGNMSDIGATGDPERARQAAATIAAYLKDLGFNCDFAPDADIASNPDSDTMRLRSFGATAEAVAPMVEAAVSTFVDAGIACSPKHFPGIGAAMGDSETELIYTDKTVDQMAEAELIPFQRAIAAGAQFVMVGHLACPAVNGDNTPASLSRAIVTDCLRDRLGFTGISITDSLGMGAVVNDYSAQTIGVLALEAGHDMILMPADFASTYQGILDAAKDGTLSAERIDQSVRRILTAKVKLGLA